VESGWKDFNPLSRLSPMLIRFGKIFLVPDNASHVPGKKHRRFEVNHLVQAEHRVTIS
jgi:hypothetical protein